MVRRSMASHSDDRVVAKEERVWVWAWVWCLFFRSGVKKNRENASSVTCPHTVSAVGWVCVCTYRRVGNS